MDDDKVRFIPGLPPSIPTGDDVLDALFPALGALTGAVAADQDYAAMSGEYVDQNGRAWAFSVSLVRAPDEEAEPEPAPPPAPITRMPWMRGR